jgi:hypothetical protein
VDATWPKHLRLEKFSANRSFFVSGSALIPSIETLALAIKPSALWGWLIFKTSGSFRADESLGMRAAALGQSLVFIGGVSGMDVAVLSSVLNHGVFDKNSPNTLMIWLNTRLSS